MMPMMAFQNQLLAVDRATPFDRMGNEKISPMTTPGDKRKRDSISWETYHLFFVSPLVFQAEVLGGTTHMLSDPMYSQSKRPEHC